MAQVKLTENIDKLFAQNGKKYPVFEQRQLTINSIDYIGNDNRGGAYEINFVETLVCEEYDAKGKFGRVLGDFLISGIKLTAMLVEEGHAVAYFGGSKEEIQLKHMANREKLLREGLISQQDYDDAVEKMKKKK